MSPINEQSRAREIYGSTIPLTIIATTAVVLRFCARKLASTPFWWDDWSIIIALVGPSC